VNHDMPEPNPTSDLAAEDPGWNSLYKAGGCAALAAAIFGGLAACVGILANLFGLGYYLTLAKPMLSFIPLSLAAPFLLIWYILIGRKLLRLGSGVLKP